MCFLSRFIGIAVCASGFLTCVPALAVDGVIEINQARAEEGGVSFNDAPGFPVSITQPGSYQLTGNLNVDRTTNAIYIDSRYVTLDLNGFSIIGPVKCTPGTSTCSPAGTGGKSGISVSNNTHYLTIKNGTVTGTGSVGVYCSNADACMIENLTVSHNSFTGIVGGSRSSIRNCRVHSNGSDGVSARANTVVDNNMISLNGGRGLWARYEGVIATSNVFYRNATTEIDMNSVITAIGGNSFDPVVTGNWFDNYSKMTEISKNMCIDGSAPYTNCTGL